jgi:tetratricopeptide (TPR) repeat protein
MRNRILSITAITFLFFLPYANPSATSQTPSAATIDSLTADYNSTMKARDYTTAITFAQQLIQLKPSSQNLLKLGNAQLYSGAFMDSLTTYDQAIAAANAEKPAKDQPMTDWNEGLSKIYISRGNALLKLHRDTDAITYYKRAAEIAPNQGQAWFNVCAVLYNNGNTVDSPAACRKATTADPTLANAWFVLASVLFVDAKADAKGKFIISDECRNALNKYLTLAPNGPHAADTHAMLEAAQ